MMTFIYKVSSFMNVHYHYFFIIISKSSNEYDSASKCSMHTTRVREQ